MPTITIHRGAKEIGGNAVELRSKNSRILIDLGTPLDYEDTGERDGLRLIESGVLPNIAGLYAWDEPTFNAILLSHAHFDHFGFLHYVHPDIPIWLSHGAKALIEINARKFHRALPQGEMKLFEAGTQFAVKDIGIIPYLVDHSAFDASAFELFADGKRVVYTGDFRRHGRKSKVFDYFTAHVKPEPDVLICEGTTLGRGGSALLSESNLENKIVKRLSGEQCSALFQCSAQNIDRLVTFYRAAVRTGRVMVVDKYTGAVLAEAHKLSGSIPTPTEKSFQAHITTRPLHDSRKALRLVRPSMTDALSEDGTLQGGVFFYSLWNGYRVGERQSAFEVFLAEHGIEIIEAHTSGHADAGTLSLLFERLRPKTVIPIHTSYPERFAELTDKAVFAENGEDIEIL